MAERALPDVKSRIRLDSSDLDKGSKKAEKFGNDVHKHMEKGTTHTLRLKESMTTLVEHMDRLPPIVGQVGRSVESMVSSFGQGASMTTVFGAAAIGALGLAIGAAEEGIHKYVELGEKVENYRRVTGASAEESSRVVQAFDLVGVSSDRAASAIFMLSKHIEAQPKKLQALGVEIATTAKGETDLNKTLLNVADAYVHAGSAQDKNAIAQAAFGRQSRDLIPVLEQGAAGLQRLEAQAKVIYTEEDLHRIREYKIAQQELKQSSDALSQSWGQALLPAQKAVVDSANEAIYVQDHLAEATRKAEQESGHHATTTRLLQQELAKEWQASQKAQHAIDEQTVSMQAAQRAADEEANAIDNLVQATEAQFNSSIALERANLNLTKSAQAVRTAQLAEQADAQRVADAQGNLNVAIRDYGPASRQAADAQIALLQAQNTAADSSTALSEAVLSQKEAYLQDAAATEKDAQDRAKMIGDTLSAADSARIYRDRLQELANQLDPGSPLRKALQGYIDELNNQVPGGVNTNVTITTSKSSRDQLDALRDEMAQIRSDAANISLPDSFTPRRGFAEGGRPDPGVPAWVGERGRELWVPDRPGTIIPNDQLGAGMAAAGGDVSVTVNAETAASAQEIAREVSWELRKMRRY